MNCIERILGHFNLSNLISIVAIVISFVSIYYSKVHDDNVRFLDMFNECYKKTFALRSKLSKTTETCWKIPFYYEYDSIIALDIMEETILDYLTELENFFSFTRKHWLTKKSFQSFASYAFYQRIASLYPYIIKKRLRTNNPDMFKNYVEIIGEMRKMQKIENQLLENQNKCYIGIRESDIYYSKNFFDNCACIFSNTPNQETFSIRHNQNIDHREIFPFYLNKVQQYNNDNVSFYFYNQRTAYNYDESIQKKCKCINAKDLLDFLNNKLSVKEWFTQNLIPVVPFATFMGKDLLYSKLCAHFQGDTAFVIQAAHGGGGIGTYYAEGQHFSEILDKVEPLQRYIVSPYISSVSVNIHIFISEKQTVLSPASIQIIELKQQQLCYRGGDFCAFQKIPSPVKEKIRQLSIKIADLLRKREYRGVAGIDFIVTPSQQVYCCEINPRFQASTFILDRYLQECNNDALMASSCFELNEMAFQGNMMTTLSFEDEINYSCYFYYNDGIPSSYFKDKSRVFEQNKQIDVFEDGMKFYLDSNKTDKNSYLFRAVFPHPISKISPDMTLWINDNITVKQRPCNNISYKTALLNQGVRVEGNRNNIKNGVYESVDISVISSPYIQPPININCAFGINLSEYSPFLIKLSESAEELYYYNEKIADISVEKNRLSSLHDLEQKMLFISTDRLRIKLVSGCENKNLGKGCTFCNVPHSEYQFSVAQIQQALQTLKNLNIDFRHILIGGGSCLAPNSWDKIIEICNYLKKDNDYAEKPISIMTMLPPKNMLTKLKNAGVEEVAFNLEIADEKLAYQLMPAKRRLGKDAYYEILQESVRIFGIGNVRSALLVGLDKEQDIYNEIITLAEIGVIPCLSAFRALPKTPYEDDLGPENAYLLKVYNCASKMLLSMSGKIKELGPPCKACRNNMLIL